MTRTREDACLIHSGQQYHHGYIAFSTFSLTSKITSSTWIGRHCLSFSVTTFSWTCPSCSLWVVRNSVGLFCVMWTLRNFDQGQRPRSCFPEGPLEKLERKALVKWHIFTTVNFSHFQRGFGRTKFKHEVHQHCDFAMQSCIAEDVSTAEWYWFVLLPWCDSEVLLDEVTHDCEGNQCDEEHWSDVRDDSKSRHTQQSGATQALQGSWNVLYKE